MKTFVRMPIVSILPGTSLKAILHLLKGHCRCFPTSGSNGNLLSNAKPRLQNCNTHLY